MLQLAQEGPDHFFIVGIDPGSTTMGVAALAVRISDLELLRIDSFTIDANKPCGGKSYPSSLEETYPARSVRMLEISRRLANAFDYYTPLQIACETPFYNPRNPNAYGVLVEVVKTVEIAVRDWNPWRPLYRIESTAAKKSVSPTDEDERKRLRLIKDSKERIKETVRIFPPLQFLDLSKMSEHEIDAVVVGYCQLLRLRNRDFTVSP